MNILKKIGEKLFWKFHKPDWDTSIFPMEVSDVLFIELRKVEHLPEFLRTLLKADRIRYFNAPDDKSRDIIKGEYIRTMYLLKSLKSEDESKPINQRISGRYGN